MPKRLSGRRSLIFQAGEKGSESGDSCQESIVVLLLASSGLPSRSDAGLKD
jgi:hypothetical protein